LIVKTAVIFTAKSPSPGIEKALSPCAITAAKKHQKSIYVKESMPKEIPAGRSGNSTVKHAEDM